MRGLCWVCWGPSSSPPISGVWADRRVWGERLRIGEGWVLCPGSDVFLKDTAPLCSISLLFTAFLPRDLMSGFLGSSRFPLRSLESALLLVGIFFCAVRRGPDGGWAWQARTGAASSVLGRHLPGS